MTKSLILQPFRSMIVNKEHCNIDIEVDHFARHPDSYLQTVVFITYRVCWHSSGL